MWCYPNLSIHFVNIYFIFYKCFSWLLVSHFDTWCSMKKLCKFVGLVIFVLVYLPWASQVLCAIYRSSVSVLYLSVKARLCKNSGPVELRYSWFVGQRATISYNTALPSASSVPFGIGNACTVVSECNTDNDARALIISKQPFYNQHLWSTWPICSALTYECKSLPHTAVSITVGLRCSLSTA